MPIVPIQNALTTSTRFPHQSPGIATGAAFGALEARALQTVGTAISKAGDDVGRALERIQEEDNQREIKRMEITLSEFIRNAQHGSGEEGDTGFLSLEGENAIDAYDSYQTAIQDMISEMSANASNGRVQEAFSGIAADRGGQALQQGLVHVNRERDTAYDSISNARIATLAEEMIADPANADRSIAGMTGEFIIAGLRNGIDEEVVTQQTTFAISDALEGMIKGVAVGDADEAAELLLQYSDRLTGSSIAKISAAIEVQQRQEIADWERAERIADDQLDEYHEANLADVVPRAISGDLTGAEVGYLVQEGMVSASMGMGLMNFTNRQDAYDPGNEEKYLEAYGKILDNEFYPTMKELIEYGGQWGLNSTQQKSLMDTATSRGSEDDVMRSYGDFERTRANITARVAEMANVLSALLDATSRMIEAKDDFDKEVKRQLDAGTRLEDIDWKKLEDFYVARWQFTDQNAAQAAIPQRWPAIQGSNRTVTSWEQMWENERYAKEWLQSDEAKELMSDGQRADELFIIEWWTALWTLELEAAGIPNPRNAEPVVEDTRGGG